MKIMLMIAATLIWISPVQAQMFRCTVDGRTTFSDKPCAADAQKIVVRPATGRGVTGAPPPDVSVEKLSADLACSPSPEDLQRFRRYDELLGQFYATARVADSTSRVSLGPVMLQMSNMRSALLEIRMDEECLKGLALVGSVYANSSVEAIAAFSRQSEDAARLLSLKAINAYLEYLRGKTMFAAQLTP